MIIQAAMGATVSACLFPPDCWQLYKLTDSELEQLVAYHGGRR